MDKNNLDELFEAAKELIESRHSFLEYSPTDDIVYLYETISFYSRAASVESMTAQGIHLFFRSSGYSFPGLGLLLKSPVLAANYYSMIEDINKISGIVILNVDLNNVKNIISDVGTEIIRHTYQVYENKIKNISFSDKNGNSFSHSKIKKTLYNYIFAISAFSDSITFGWAYLKTITDLFKCGITEIDANQLKKNVIEKVKSYSSKIESLSSYFSDKYIEYIDKFTKDNSNSEEEIYNDLHNNLQNYIEFQIFMKNIECQELSSIIQKNVTIHNFNTSIISDQLSTVVFEILNNPSVCYTSKNILEYEKGLSKCASMLYDLQKKYLSGAVRISSDCVSDIIIQYSKYAAKNLEIPCTNVFYEKQAEYYFLMPCPQTIEGFVNTIQKLINQRPVYEKFEISRITTLWGQMIADITNSITENKDLEIRLINISKYLISSIIFYFASTDISKQIPNNLKDFESLQVFFNSKYTNLNEILYYCPQYYQSLSFNTDVITKNEYKNLIYFILTRYVGNLLFQFVNTNITDEQILKEFESFDIVSEIDKDLQKIDRFLS